MSGAGALFSHPAWDVRALDDLKRQASANSADNGRAVARQVEGMFVQQMLKSMREALPKDGLFSNEQTRMYTSFYDQQIAQQMSAKGLGLADMLERQINALQSGVQPDAEMPQTPLKYDAQVVQRYQTQSLAGMVSKAMPRPEAVNIGANALDGDSRRFLATLALPAKLASAGSGIPHHLILAQAALESGWGQRQIRTAEGGPSFNLFGIKASSDWQGRTTEITTTEYENGTPHKQKARFRVYDSWQDALSDYVKLLSNNPRYAAVTNANSPEQGAQALQQAGYATDPHYARKLTSLINQLRSLTGTISSADLDPDSLF